MPHANRHVLFLLVSVLLSSAPLRAEPPPDGGEQAAQAPVAVQGEGAQESPAPVASPQASAQPADSGPAASEVSARMDALMDRMVRARTRLSALGQALHQTRVRVTLDHRVKGFRVERVRLFLDGSPVYEGDGRGLARKEDVELFAGFAAPGMHEVRLEVDQVSNDDGRYGYTLQQRFRFRAVEDQRTTLRVRMDDDSDIAEDFEDDQDGEYDVRTRIRVWAEPLEDR